MTGDLGHLVWGLQEIHPLDEDLYRQIQERWDSVAKPVRGLGCFEDMISRIGAVAGTQDVSLEKRAVLIMCADNGIVEEGVSQSGQEVTALVAGWMGRGTSSVCRMASVAGADIIPVDIGINMDGSPEGVLDRKIRRGTGNFLREPAMTQEELLKAVHSGISLVRDCRDRGYTLLATGEMGIGNTTTSAAVCAALLHLPAGLVTGRGAGLSLEGLRRKTAAVESALRKYGLGDAFPNRREHAEYVLRSVGGLDIAALAGVFLGGALYHVPVIIDGFISATAALAAEWLLPGTKEIMLASHMGREKGMKLVFGELGIRPVIDGDLALGEGTGAVMLFPLLDMALALYREGTPFADTPIAPYGHYGETV